MDKSNETRIDVAVVGVGPSGLSLGAGLKSRNLRFTCQANAHVGHANAEERVVEV
jgi:cation diffusion facilitator CzcD-associated flavoprotein CzcO